MSIVPVDFGDSQHNAIIMKLCERNKFYEGDVYAEIYRDAPPAMKNALNPEQIERLKKWLLDARGTAVSHGYFIVDKEKGKNSVVGFIIYNIEEQLRGSSLLFLLIDKKYQNQSFGTKLMHKYMEDIRKLDIFMAVVKSESAALNKWYKKFGFEKRPAIPQSSADFELLHYFRPAGAAVKLKDV
jgi:ribosomal protein S18 acetylase RimI-like enzyme